MKKKRLFGVIVGFVLLFMVLIVVRERYTNPMPIPATTQVEEKLEVKPEPEKQKPTNLDHPIYRITSFSYDVEREFGGVKGIEFTIDIAFDHCEGKDICVLAPLCYKDNSGQWVDAQYSNKGDEWYVSSNGTICVQGEKEIENAYEYGVMRGYKLFVPYEVIVHPKGDVKYRLGVMAYAKSNKEEQSRLLYMESGSAYSYHEFDIEWYSENTKASEKKNNTTTTSNSSTYHSSKPTRVYSPDGSYIEYTVLEDGRTMTRTVMPCNLCHGSNICPACNGTGGRMGPAYGGTWYQCTLCGGTGHRQCPVCGGKGEIVTIAYIKGDGTGFGMSSNGSTSQISPAGTIVFTQIGTTVYPAGGGSSSSHSSSSKKYDYIEKKVYAPRYVGDEPDVWCEQCKKWGPSHSHVKERVY